MIDDQLFCAKIKACNVLISEIKKDRKMRFMPRNKSQKNLNFAYQTF